MKGLSVLLTVLLMVLAHKLSTWMGATGTLPRSPGQQAYTVNWNGSPSLAKTHAIVTTFAL